MQHIDSDLIRGNIDTIILKTMLNEDKYGLDIIKEVSEKSSGTYELKQPTLYSCLKRLENQELISSYWVDSDIGGRRHYYKLTDKGREFYEKKQEEWAKSKFIIDNLLSNYNYEEYRLVKKDEFDEILQQKANTPLSNISQVEEHPQEAETSLEESVEEIDNDDVVEESEKISFKPTQESSENIPSEEEIIEAFRSELNSEEDDDDESEYGTYYQQSSNSEYYDDDEDEDEDAFVDESDEFSGIQTIEDLENYLSSQDTDVTTTENDVFDLGENENSESTENINFDKDLDDTTEDNDYPVYFSAKENSEDNQDQQYVSYETKDQSSNELNILSRLHDQDDEEINTYYGDQKSYVNHLNQLSESQIEQQDLLDSSLYVNPNLVNKSIDEFTSAINKLNSFGSSSTDVDDEEDDDSMEDIVDDSDDQASLTIQNDEPAYNKFEEKQSILENKIDDLEELNSLNNMSSNAFFYSKDKTEYNIINTQNYNYENKTNPELEFEPENYDFKNVSSQSFEEISNEIEPNFSNEYAIETTNNSFIQENNCNNFSDIDEIISTNIATEYPEASQHFFKNQTSVNYREKLSDLSKYSKVTLDEEKQEIANTYAIEKAKDISEITKELEEEGIRIKEHYKSTNLKGLNKNYLLSNKINLMKSLIMLFGYVFILSAIYIVLNNTPMKNNSWFNITPFLIGFIPFVVLVLYRVILFAINPYKKIDAKYHARIMLFISIIITIQLLLITYCVNLQLGFYSFTQKGYNHLFWIIPTIISFAPIIDHLVYLALFKSKNFNV